MLCLRIVSFAQYLLDEDMSPACRGDDPKKHAQRERQSQESRRGSLVRGYLRQSSAPFLSA
jgi:hypothetical protein